MIEITLRVSGIDLESEATENVLAEQFSDTFWETVDGMVTVTAFVERRDAVAEVIDVARRLEKQLDGLKIVGVHRDLVGVTDIAQRAGVSREGARKWTAAKDFPVPFDYIGAGSMKIWAWTEIASWLKSARELDLEEDLPSLELMTQIENCLMRNPDHTSVQWHQAVMKLPTVQPKFQTVLPAVRVSAGGRAQKVVTAVYDLVGAAAHV
ncbi:hypothetical protein GCM10009712_02960 [Pseudarthrobacter sulfonivorans]|uniref:helix-turn-helix transcriptional regulator n=1 Tax=Pseudarthrobacter sulfonivorans TaxID=121292 RepID=UPI00168BC402|nr:hypothetical protein [Pseudarthrobacter sulfonivorans]